MSEVIDRESKIRWAPKVQPEKIRRLYLQDARGIVDEDLIDDVGLALYLRCESIVLASTGRVKCPACGAVVPVKMPRVPAEDGQVARCGQCGWQTTAGEWHASWRHRELHAGWGLPAIEAYRDRYLRATTARERMLLIDQLLHAFHQDLRRDAPHRSVAHNLVEGNHRQALALLDDLAYGEGSTPEVQATYTHWRRAAERTGRLARQSHAGDDSSERLGAGNPSKEAPMRRLTPDTSSGDERTLE